MTRLRGVRTGGPRAGLFASIPVMATTRKRSTRSRRSTHIAAKPTRDAEFLALLRQQCLRAARVGALTAAGELIPGLSRVLGLVFGELLDARFLAGIQRDLIE